jgi:hypothetical protein
MEIALAWKRKNRSGSRISILTCRTHMPAARKEPLAATNDCDPFEAEFQRRADTEKRAPFGEAYIDAPLGQG